MPPLLQKILTTLVLLCFLLPVEAYDAFTDYPLSGSPISRNQSLTAANAFDGNSTTYYIAPSADMQWVGLDLGKPHVVTRIIFTPRAGMAGAERMLLAVFEGANRADFMDAVPLHLVSQQPVGGLPSTVDVDVSRGFRYLRMVGPAGSQCQVAELAFFGHESEGDDSRFYQITELPTVSLHIERAEVPVMKGQDFASTLCITYEGGSLIQEYPILTRVRGNFSATHENRPYRIKFADGKSHHMLRGSARDESPAKAKKWVLVNNYGDKTLVRNNVAFEVSRRIGMPFTPWCRCVDVLLNGEYRGTYQLTDHVSTDPQRVPVSELDPTYTQPDEITGGYLIEMNGYADGDPVHFTTPHGNPISVKEPDEDDILPLHFDYIHSYFCEMERRLFSPEYTHPQLGYRAMLDVESFLRYFLANEFSGNTDMIWQVFMYKERGDSLIYTGPVWDNDLALENDHNVYPGNERQDWTYTVRQAGQWGQVVRRVLSDPLAHSRLREMWAELRDRGTFTANNIVAYVDSLRQLVNRSQALNHIRWPYLRQQIHCNPKVWGSWEAEMDNVCRYVAGRVAWMDRKLAYGSLPQQNGIYQIATGRDLVTFSRLVAAGERGANAVLVADIDMSGLSAQFEPIGKDASSYTGHFHGQGHTIDGLHISGTRSVGLFGTVSSGANISGVHLGPGCHIQGTDYVAALVGNVRSGQLTLAACGNQGRVTATGTGAAALVGQMRATARVEITDCYNVGHIQATAQAAQLVGPCSGQLSISHSYHAGTLDGGDEGKDMVWSQSQPTLVGCYGVASTQVNAVSQADVPSGRLCHLLCQEGGEDSPWGQNLDNGEPVDHFPLPIASHGMVYERGGGYSNVSPHFAGYRYYMLEILGVREGDIVQLSEFDLLLPGQREVGGLGLYASTGEHFGGEEQELLTDNDVHTKWCGYFQSPTYLYFDAGEAIRPLSYRLYTANDTREMPGRNPVSWRLWGSEESSVRPGPQWALLDERTDCHTMQAANYQPFDFRITRPIDGTGMAWPYWSQATGKRPGFGTFDLGGRRIDAATHHSGIVVKNGKKYLERP